MSHPLPYTVTLTGLKFYGPHGVAHAEREVGHWFELDLELHLSSSAPLTDALADTLDYAAIAQTIHTEQLAHPSHLIEHLAHHLGTALLTQNPALNRVTLHLKKLAPPFPLTVSSVGVSLTLSRESS